MHSREVISLAQARREFLRKESPWVIGAGIVALVALRAALGELSWRDAVSVAAMLAVYPFGEWAIHVFLLHAKPMRILGHKIDTMAARAHRAHHQEPHDLNMVALYWWQAAFLMLVAVPLTITLGALITTAVAGPVPLGAMVSAGMAGYSMILLYEWTHFLIHTAYRPRTRAYRTIWRNHRLHHFKNEHFWHGVTNNLSDRVLGTNPEAGEVPRSETARTLDRGAAT
jgi:Fatty acid hydroxylase superfamily